MKKFLPVLGLIIGIGASTLATPVAYASTQDCDSNAVVYCGATTQSELNSKIAHGDTRNSAANLQALYASKGMTTAAINATVMGTVTKSGEVLVNNKVIATGAKSDGRNQKSGSVRDGSLWLTPTSVSFISDSIPAFISIKNGQFQWAILTACGNMVSAQPKPTPTPTPKPTPTNTPTPTPTHTPKPTPVSTPTPTPTPLPTPTSTPKPAPLPATGPVGPISGAFGLTGIAVAAKSYAASRRKLTATLKRTVDK